MHTRAVRRLAQGGHVRLVSRSLYVPGRATISKLGLHAHTHEGQARRLLCHASASDGGDFSQRPQVHRNLDPALHPHEKAIEYTRALNAAKLQRVFAKPFLAALPHDDGAETHLNSLYCISALCQTPHLACCRQNDLPVRICIDFHYRIGELSAFLLTFACQMDASSETCRHHGAGT